MVERLFLTVPLGCLQFVIVVYPDHTHFLFLVIENNNYCKFENVSVLFSRNLADAKSCEQKSSQIVKISLVK